MGGALPDPAWSTFTVLRLPLCKGSAPAENKAAGQRAAFLLPKEEKDRMRGY